MNNNLSIATELITCFEEARGCTQGELNRQLQELEGDTPDYRLKRGLAHLLKSMCEFEIVSPLEPQLLRERVFALSAQSIPSSYQSSQTLNTLALQMSQELEREVLAEQIRSGLYADLAENRIMTQFDVPTPENLLHRYNLSQVQGVFYRASHLTLNAHRNVPGEYKLLFRYLKLFQLMAYIEGMQITGLRLRLMALRVCLIQVRGMDLRSLN
jgi:predicted nuclease of restriction endonuclease-like RecB superfamily